ncbi:flagellar hook-basal body complex protein [Legionella quinlivanii]|uniref:Flagellar hook-basal body complex protein FliE n=1 Tax=Legionella quinlivanii TaxID=45073 RepID=A0A0W0XZ62_9GAMM|nr:MULTISPECIES: flagellar hook-basal body complex protein FliE [Legionella]KTD50071.1 flagellar hook-basal body complex protein [Legionella quinlivanii]MCE3046087.1 flagellar hook-basal body complex protein FliE [Legionella sp. 16cNR16C]MCW8450184.1 flagellar hook-basal body complex protein FliE [Legionella quinlivanii]RAP38617.1 flagellar hook-basal body complex protein FliE [Legionella quinlivanii]SEF51532.1 flagellar hook-basal body complex protein FliE [Legionella quinlivanii DSM 21216]
MTDVNTVSLFNQMRVMAAEAQGKAPELTPATTSFGDIFHNAMGEVNQLSQTADHLRNQFEVGAANVSLGDVMIAAQKSNIAFEATLRVRNKLVQAYQDIMNMPV